MRILDQVLQDMAEFRVRTGRSKTAMSMDLMTDASFIRRLEVGRVTAITTDTVDKIYDYMEAYEDALKGLEE